MRRKLTMVIGCDALDVAALWQSMPQIAGFPLFDIEESVRAANSYRERGTDDGNR